MTDRDYEAKYMGAMGTIARLQATIDRLESGLEQYRATNQELRESVRVLLETVKDALRAGHGDAASEALDTVVEKLRGTA